MVGLLMKIKRSNKLNKMPFIITFFLCILEIVRKYQRKCFSLLERGYLFWNVPKRKVRNLNWDEREHILAINPKNIDVVLSLLSFLLL
jgi:hypothetical protein